MKFFKYLISAIFICSSTANAEIVDMNNAALPIFGTGCEELKQGESNATIRLKATDKACFNAVSGLKEIINIKDSFNDHDFHVMIYNIIDEYIEDMAIKTAKKDNSQICVEISGYVTPENIGHAIDNTIKTPEEVIKKNLEEKKQNIEVNVEAKKNSRELVPEINNNVENNVATTVANEEIITDTTATEPSKELLQIPETDIYANDNPNIVVLSAIYIKPTEFYNNTQSNSHSKILKKILEQSEQIKIVKNEDEANFVVTPKVLKAKVESLNTETNRMQMVVAIETFDKNKNTTTTEHQNKFVLFNTDDDEQEVAKTLLTQLFELGATTTISIAEKSSRDFFNKNRQSFLPEVITVMPKKY